MSNEGRSEQIGVGLRLVSMLLDHIFMTFIAILFFLPGMISTFTSPLGEVPPDPMSGIPGYIALFGFALYFCKDGLDGRSIAKRILKLQVVDHSSGIAASPMRCFIRNLTCVLWPIEGIVAIINPERRLGDRIAGTKLVRFNPSSGPSRVNLVRVIVPVFISYGIILVLVQGIPHPNKIHYVESSYNHSESANLEKLLMDSLGQYLIPETKVYDTMTNAKVKYILTILRLKEDYMEDEGTFEKLKARTLGLIYADFPKETFTGDIVYFYKSSGHLQSWSSPIGTYPIPKEDHFQATPPRQTNTH